MTRPYRTVPRRHGWGQPVTVTDHAILTWVTRHPGCRTRAVADAIHLDRSTTAVRLRNLLVEGAVVCSVPHRGRVTLWWVTGDPDAGTVILDVERYDAADLAAGITA